MKRILRLLVLTVLIGIAASCGNTAQPVSAGDAALSVIMNRKSVRNFTGEKLSEIQIETLLKAAMAAPTEGNNQPWEMVVLTDSAVVNKLFGAGHHSQTYKDAGAVIIVCGHTTVFRRPRGQTDAEPQEMPSQYWFEDCSAASENLLLAAEAIGLGAVWLSAYPDERKMEGIIRELDLPETVLPLSVIPVGYPSEEQQPKDKWKPEKVHYNKW